MALIIKNADVYDAVSGVRGYKAVCINDDGKIESLTNDISSEDMFMRRNADDIYTVDASGMLVMPGFVNLHTHSPMTVLRNIGSDLPLRKWLFNEILPREARLKPEDVYYGSLLGQIEMIRSGTTSFVDMYEPFDSLAAAVSASGLRAAVSIPMLHNDFSSGSRVTEKRFEKAAESLRRWNKAASGRLNAMCEMHSVYLYDKSLLKDVAAFAAENGLAINMHLNETETEIIDCISETGMRPAVFLESVGAFDVPVVAAHCTVMNDEDIEIIKRRSIFPAVNMTSNLKLASGIPPLPRFIDEGINFGFGTDGCASNNNLNMFEEIHIASLLYKGLMKDPELVKPRRVLNAAFFGNEIKEGAFADIVIADMRAPHLNPVHDIESDIVYSMQGSDIDTVIVNGKVLMEKRELKTLDEERIIYEVNNVKL